MRAGLVAVVALVACGGHAKSTTRDGAPRDGARSDAKGSGANDAPGSGSGSDASGSATDHTVVCATSAGSCTSTPTPPMNASNESYCCQQTAGSVCVQGNLGSCETGNPWYCDHAADCNAGLVCCNSTVRSGLLGCEPSASCGSIQVCKTSAECVNGQTCVTRSCLGSTIGTCGALTTQEAAALCP